MAANLLYPPGSSLSPEVLTSFVLPPYIALFHFKLLLAVFINNLIWDFVNNPLQIYHNIFLDVHHQKVIRFFRNSYWLHPASSVHIRQLTLSLQTRFLITYIFLYVYIL